MIYRCFRAVFCLTLCLVLLPAEAWSYPYANILELPECQGHKPTLTPDGIMVLRENHLFPGPFGSLAITLNRINELNKANASCLRVQPKLPLPQLADGQRALDQVTNQLLAAISKELQTQTLRNDRALECVRLTREIMSGKGIKQEEIALKDFEDLKYGSADPKICYNFLKAHIPALERRLKLMREMMVLSIPPGSLSKQELLTWGYVVKHDKPFAVDLAGAFYPTIWNQKSQEKLNPLTPIEREEANELAKKIDPHQAEGLYYHLLSATPILLFFNDQVTLDSLEKAYTEIKKQNVFDVEELRKNPPQTLSQMIPFVREALSNIPKGEQRGNACVVLNEMSKNVFTKYETSPRLLAMAALMLSLPVGAGEATVFGLANGGKIYGIAKQALAGISARLALTSIPLGVTQTMNSFQIYSESVAYCSAVSYQKSDVLDSIDKSSSTLAREYKNVCDFKAANESYKEGVSAVVLTGFTGGSLYGVGKLLKNKK
jgi:hypothetical protein